MNGITRAGHSTLAGVLVVALAIPAVAIAAPRLSQARQPASTHANTPPAVASAPRPSSSTPAEQFAVAQGQPSTALGRRIANVLAARKRRFDAASKAITAHIARVGAIADKAATAGADVADARVALSSATDALAKASALEESAVAEFQAIPESADRRAGFRRARAEGARAVAQLKAARAMVITAVHELRSAIKVNSAGADESSDSP
jgi:hypothetical protein